MAKRFSTAILHQTFLDSLAPYVEEHSSIEEKPLMVQLKAPYNLRLKVYLFNCTNPPGARQAGECKSQLILPGQLRGQRGHFDLDPNAVTILAGLASITELIEDAIFVIWELKKHMEFAYSANVQVSLSTLLRAYAEPMFTMKKRGNGEWVVVSRPSHLAEAIQKRIDLDIDLLLED